MDAETSQLLLILSKHENGATTETLLSELSSEWTAADIVEQMNILSQKQLVEFIQVNNKLMFRSRNAIEVSQTKGMDNNERIIFNLIKATGNKGIWIKDLKTKSNCHSQIVTTIIKKLEKSQVIKSVKPVKNSTRKVYMLFEFEPCIDVTGGAWYTESTFDTAFVDALSTQCFKYILSKSFPKEVNSIYPSNYKNYPTISSILSFLKTSKITEIELSRDDIQQLLDALVYDGRIKKRLKDDKLTDVEFSDEDDDDYYKEHDKYMFIAIKSAGVKNGLTAVPCGRCTISEYCSESGPITPATCEYYDKWLNSW